MRLSCIVPALDEAEQIGATLAALRDWRRAGHEVIVVDGGSTDATRDLAAPLADTVLAAPRGRARQMNAGAALASGREWGRFDVRLSGRAPLLRVIERAMNLRSRLQGLATGDQAMFVARAAFEAVGGFPDQPLMEDLALSRALRRRGRPACLRERVVTSSRRWEREGLLPTIALMWWLRARYALGAAPERLAARYRR